MNKSYSYLSIVGGDFNPNNITGLLGIKPDDSCHKGDKDKRIPSRKVCFACSSWQSEKFTDTKENIIYEQIESVYELFKDKKKELISISKDFNAKIFLEIVPHVNHSTQLSFTPEVMKFCRDINASIDIDYYIRDTFDENCYYDVNKFTCFAILGDFDLQAAKEIFDTLNVESVTGLSKNSNMPYLRALRHDDAADEIVDLLSGTVKDLTTLFDRLECIRTLDEIYFVLDIVIRFDSSVANDKPIIDLTPEIMDFCVEHNISIRVFFIIY